MSEIRQRKYNGKKKAAEPSEQLVKKTYNVVSIDTSSGHLGVTLANAKDGVLIEDLCDADLFYKAGLRSGDILKTVNDQAVSVHDHCLAIFDDCKGTTVNVEYVTAAELTAEFNALRKARRMRVYGCCWFMVKLILYIVIGLPVLLIVLGIPAAHVAHRLLPQKTFADHFDMAILMRLPPRWYEPLGFKKPQMGYDARPKRRVVPPSDPSKPWTIPGWDEAKEKDAIARYQKTFFYKMRAQTEARAEGVATMDSTNVKDMLEQIRNSNGEVLEFIENMDMQMNKQKAMYQQAMEMNPNMKMQDMVF